MLNLSVPALLKVRDDITINLSLSVSQSIEYGAPQFKVKDDIKAKSDAGELKRALTKDDYDEIGKANVVTFFFSDGRSLQYRVGEEITEDDFRRIEADLHTLTYQRKK